MAYNSSLPTPETNNSQYGIHSNGSTLFPVEEEYTMPPPLYSPAGTGILAFMTAITSLFTTTGNILVLISFIVEKNLRQPSNYLIASLAVTDILIGMFSMPFYSLYLLKNSWPLGQTLCDLWLSMDYTVCLVSQYTVFLITLDRFCSVKAPAKYRNWRTKRRIKIMIAVTWLFPAFIFFTSIMGWRTFTGGEAPKNFTCAVEFLSHKLFTVILVISYYWVTLIIMTGLYIGIYKVAWSLHAKSKAKQKRMKLTNSKSTGNKNATSQTLDDKKKLSTRKYDAEKVAKKLNEREDTSDLSNDPCSSESSSSKRNDSAELEQQSAKADTLEKDTNLSDSPIWKPRGSFESGSVRWEVFNKKPSISDAENAEANKLLKVDCVATETQKSANTHQVKSPETSKGNFLSQINSILIQLRKRDWCRKGSNTIIGSPRKSRCENRARKALRTISFILGAFALCWTPYHVVIIIYSYCPSCINVTFYNFTYWLCYMNSPINPFCYALSNGQFKSTFIKIIKGHYFRRRGYLRR